MPRANVLTNIIHTVYIADGFSEDCDALMLKCSQINTLSYKKFCEFWKEMNFSAVFYDRYTNAELAELSEELLHIAKSYMIRNTTDLEESVAGLFLVYGLLNLQPFANFASIRFVPQDVAFLKNIESEARRMRRQDVLYALGFVLIKGSQCHVVERERGFEYPIRKYLEGTSTLDKSGFRPTGVLFRQNKEMEMIRELEKLDVAYKVAKADLGSPDKSLRYVDENFGSNLHSSLMKTIIGHIDYNDDDDDETDDKEQPSQESALTIKQKAMRSSVLPMKHLIGLEQRNKSPIKSPEKTADNNKSPEKGAARSPKKGADRCPKKGATVSPKKGTPSSPKRRKLNKLKEDKDKKNQDDVGNNDIEGMNNIVVKNNPKTEPIAVSGKFNVGINSLPDITNINDSECEIEFIDYQNVNNEAAINDEISSTINIPPDGNVIKKKIDIDDEDDEIGSDDDKFKKPFVDAIVLRRLERRELKKPRVKTKFRRQGLLAVANFKEKQC